MSNSDPPHPSAIAALREAIEFSGTFVFLNAPRCAITLFEKPVGLAFIDLFVFVVEHATTTSTAIVKQKYLAGASICNVKKNW